MGFDLVRRFPDEDRNVALTYLPVLPYMARPCCLLPLSLAGWRIV